MSTVVIGIGNILFRDEGIGIYASKYLEHNYSYSDELTVIDGGTLGFKLMTYYQSYDKVIILDTVSIKDSAGSIYNLPSQELLDLGTYRQTAHEVEVVEMLEICSMLESMAEVKIMGIVPKDIESVLIDLTDEMKSAFDSFIDAIIKELESTGLKMTPKENKLSLEEIIQEYANPSAKDLKVS
jgi:hydrogenase maturation protease